MEARKHGGMAFRWAKRHSPIFYSKRETIIQHRQQLRAAMFTYYIILSLAGANGTGILEVTTQIVLATYTNNEFFYHFSFKILLLAQSTTRGSAVLCRGTYHPHTKS